MTLRRQPYIETDNRLGDVIAAIQATGSYKFYKLSFEAWANRISGDSSKADHWKAVFEEHPEFFRLDNERLRASLVLRRQQPKLFDVDAGVMVSKTEYANLGPEAKARISRRPLEPNQIEALINVAISLHSRAAERARDRRWWIPPGLAFLGALAGGIISAIVK